jgi:8-oxo-dGTP diphosphatase
MNTKAPLRSVVKVTAALIEREGKVLIARRASGAGPFGGLWEFPGGKVEAGESPEEGLRRELAEELGVDSRIVAFAGAFPYTGPQACLEILAFRVVLLTEDLEPAEHEEVRWVDPAGLDESAFAEPDRPIVRRLAALSRGSGQSTP